MTDERASYGRERLVEVYTQGMLAGQLPSVPPRFEDLEAAAREALEPEAYAYVAGSAGGERTERENREAFSRWRIVPRMLRDVAERDLSAELFGERYPAPVALAPIGVQLILHDEGELGSARAAADLGFPFVQSSAATEPLESGADGVVVSNHGGRQVDNALPAIEALPQVIDHLADEGYGDAPVLFDSGIRRGADAVVALALGASMVLLGRPSVYGLAIDGEDGVREVGRNFLADLDLTMGLAGRASVDDLDRSMLVESSGSVLEG